MTLNFAGNPGKILFAAIAAALLSLPAWSQDAEDPAGSETPQNPVQDAPEATGEEQPEDAGEPAAEGGEPAEAQAGAGEAAGESAEPAAGEAEPAAGEEAEGGPVVLDVEEGTVLDDQTFEGDDDDFIPSEQIPIDHAIPFPTDI